MAALAATGPCGLGGGGGGSASWIRQRRIRGVRLAVAADTTRRRPFAWNPTWNGWTACAVLQRENCRAVAADERHPAVVVFLFVNLQASVFV